MAVNRRRICGHCYCRKTTQMIRYECDRCGVALGVNDPQRFIVRFEIFAAAGHIDLDADAAKEPRRGLEEIVQELRDRAKDALVIKAIADEEELGDVEPAEDLLALEGMDRRLAFKLASNEVVTREDLAEQAVFDLIEIDEDLGEERAAELIMAARAHWFEDEDEVEVEDADGAEAQSD